VKELYHWSNEVGKQCYTLDGAELSFKPIQLIYHFSLSQHSPLEHLVLTTATDAKDKILPQDRIEHFKMFTKLTHLEIDSRLLRNRRNSESNSPVYYQSLTDFLPTSIHFVSVNLRKDHFHTVYQMLQDIPEQRSSFPTLRHIAIRFAEYGTLHDASLQS
jgi:hypothetical protein